MGWKIALWAGLVVLALAFLYVVRGILLPFVLAFLIAALLEPTVRKLRRRGLSRPAAVALVFSVFFFFATVLVVRFAPVVSAQLGTFAGRLERYTQALAREDPNATVFMRWNPAVAPREEAYMEPIDQFLAQVEPILRFLGQPTTREGLIDQYVRPNQAEIARAVENFFQGFIGLIGSIASRLVLLLFTPLLAWMMMMDMDRLRTAGASWIPPAIRASTLSILADVFDVFVRYLRGVTLTICLYIVASAIVLGFLQIPYFVLLAILFGALYLLPYIGMLIMVLTVVLVCGLNGQTGNFMFDLGNPWTFGIVAAVIYGFLNELFDKLVYPRLIGAAVGLNPVVSIFVVFAGAALFGIVGMIIAFPLAGSIKVILDRLIRLTTAAPSEGLLLPVTPLRHRSLSEV